MTDYTVSDVAKLLSLSPGQVRRYARSSWLSPRKGSRGELRFSFQDLVLLRTAQGLREKKVPPRKVNEALGNLRAALSEDQPMSAVQVSQEGRALVVEDDEARWDPASGQVLFDFDVAELQAKVQALPRRAEVVPLDPDAAMDADQWVELGLELAASDPDRARDAYRRALERAPGHTEARLQLGRQLWQRGWLEAAEAQLEVAVRLAPESARAAFHLGTFREDQDRETEALSLYQRAVELDPALKEAYLALSRIYERQGDKKRALRSLEAFRS